MRPKQGSTLAPTFDLVRMRAFSAWSTAPPCPRQNPDPTTKNASFREKFTVESPDMRWV